ncbi:MAG: SRPBCC family protein [candidate division Zixibacteria bacterium]|nr:SRPBCC family protein [candidate division Zixibacteria bacterium]
MKVHSLLREQNVPRPRVEVFDFFSKPENLARITPSSLGFVILTPTPIAMHAGTVIDYTIRVTGLRLHWTTLISAFEPPHRFVDIQLCGPYAFWHHTHTFEETKVGTLIKDDVQYALPLGPLGDIAHTLVVQRQLQHIFNYRYGIIDQIFSEKRD